MTNKKLATLIQYLAPQHTLSWIAGQLGECRWVWLKNHLIQYFITRYNININDTTLTSITDYPNFNSFFTRYLKPELRPIVDHPQAIASPVDGSVSQYGKIEQDLLFQAKGFQFSLATLVGGNEQLAQTFYDGHFATLYLAPKDYHRVHMPIEGSLRQTIYIPGRLFSVNQATASAIPNLFARNERLVCLFDTALGPMVMILVGAMLVGSINTVWNTTPPAFRKITTTSFPVTGQQEVTLKRGAEMGHFKMGSTVILLFPKDTMQWQAQLHAGSTIKMGEFLGNISIP